MDVCKLGTAVSNVFVLPNTRGAAPLKSHGGGIKFSVDDLAFAFVLLVVRERRPTLSNRNTFPNSTGQHPTE